MSREERRWCLGFGAVVAIVTSLPYLLAFARQGDAWRFTGFLFGVEDGNSYLAKMLAGSYGAWLFRTPYTTEPQSGILAFLPYLVLGKLASGAGRHEQLVALFHLARVVLALVGVLATYSFCSRFLAGSRSRQWATIVATIGGGIGWVAVLAGRSDLYGSLPLELYSPETFGFLAYLGLPHLVAGRALLLAALGLYLDAQRHADRVPRAGALLLALGLFQPLGVVSAWAVIGAHVLLDSWLGERGREALLVRLRTAGTVVAFSSPIVLYYAGLGLFDPFVREWTRQNVIRSPHPVHYLLAYGPAATIAIAGLIRRWPRGPGLLPLGWLVITPILAYAPLDLQRRLPDGAWVAIVILAFSAIDGWQERRASIASLVFTALAIPSGVILLAGATQTANAPAAPAFVPLEAVRAYEAMSGLAQPGDAVLASFDTGNILPAWAPVRVPIGHGPESVHLATLREEVDSVYRAETSDDERLGFFVEHSIRFVFLGPPEHQLGLWEPQAAAYLRLKYSSGDYQIYSVTHIDDCDCGKPGAGG